jgi:hypothetical protein
MTGKIPSEAQKRWQQHEQEREARLAALAEEFLRIEGEGLEKDIAQGGLLREAHDILIEKQGWCHYVLHDLRSNMVQADRLIARARAADWVTFNELLNLTRTAIDILAAKKVRSSRPLKDAIAKSKQGERITEAVAKEIVDKHLELYGMKRRKKRARPSQEVTPPRALARHLSQYPLDQISRIADSAVGQARKNGSTGQNSTSRLEALRWVKPALPKPAAIKAGIATDCVLFHDSFASLYSGSLLARAPCAQDGTFMVCFGILEGLSRLEAWREEEPQLRHEDDRVRFVIPGDDGKCSLTPEPIEGFCPNDEGLRDRYPDGERHALPVLFSTALASLHRLASPKPGNRVNNGVWLFDRAALVVNPPMIACVRDVGIRASEALWVPDEAIRFIMKNRYGPDELFIEPDWFWLKWADGNHIGIERENSPEGAQDVLAEALARLDAHADPAVKIDNKRPTVFERANGIAAMSVLVQPDRLCANAALSSGPTEPSSRSGDTFDFNGYSNFLPFQYGDIVGLIGLSNESEREDDAAAE